MFSIILFIANIRFSNLFNGSALYKNSINLLVLLLNIFSSFSSASSLKVFSNSNNNISFNSVYNFILFSLLLVYVIFDFFPIYVSKTHFIHKLYPKKIYERILIENIISLMSFKFLNCLMFAIIFFSILEKYHFIILSLLILYLGQIINSLVKNIIEEVINKLILCLSTLLLLTSIILSLPIYLSLESLIIACIISSLSYLLLEYSITEKKYGTSAQNTKNRNYNEIYLLWRFMLSNKILRNSLLIAYSFKTFAIMAFSYVIYNGRRVEDILLIHIFMSHTILFSYVFNNFFGFSEKLWLCIQLFGQPRFLLIKAYLICIAPVILIDVFFFNLFMIILDKSILYHLLYLISLFFSITIGFISSLNSPIKVEASKFFTSILTPVIFNILSVLPYILGFIILKHLDLMPFIFYLIFILILTFYVIFNNRKLNDNVKFILYQKLFK